jgi:hypothetical protein
MINIKPIKTRISNGKEVTVNKSFSKKNSQPEKVTRTGQNTFTVAHNDGSSFDCQIDPKKVKFAEDGRRTASRFHIPDKVAIHNVMSNKDRQRLGLEVDPDLSN